MKHLLKNKRELLFWATGILLLALTLGYTGYSVQFLVGKLNSATNSKTETPPATTFDSAGFKSLLTGKFTPPDETPPETVEEPTAATSTESEPAP